MAVVGVVVVLVGLVWLNGVVNVVVGASIKLLLILTIVAYCDYCYFRYGCFLRLQQ